MRNKEPNFDYYASKCACGAITITNKEGEDKFDNSMRPVTFQKLFKGTGTRFKWTDGYCNCNHCVNHWGTDICSCGSGEKVGKCDCRSKRPYQTLYARTPNCVEAIAAREHF